MRVGFSVFKPVESSTHHIFGIVGRATAMICLVMLCGCRDESVATPIRAEREAPEDSSSPAEKEDKTYDGLTVLEWRSRMKQLGPNVPGASSAIKGLTQLAADRTADPVDRRQATMMIGRLGRPGLSSLSTLKMLLNEEAQANHAPAAWAAKAIALLGPAAKEATPELIARLNAPSARLEARLACLEALARIGGVHADAIPALVEQLKSPATKLDFQQRLEIQRGAVDALALIGPDASVAVPALMNHLEDADDLLRTRVVMALGAIGPSASPASSALAEKLVFDDAEEVRREAALALAQVGADGQRLLVGLTRDEEPQVREFSLIALGRTAPLTAEAVAALTSSLDDEHDRIRLVAAQALSAQPQSREKVVSTLIELLVNSERRIRREAADFWTTMKIDAEEWSRLEELMGSATDDYSRRLWHSLLRSRP